MPLTIADDDVEHVRALARDYLRMTRYAETPPREPGEPPAGADVVQRREACKRLLLETETVDG